MLQFAAWSDILYESSWLDYGMFYLLGVEGQVSRLSESSSSDNSSDGESSSSGSGSSTSSSESGKGSNKNYLTL